VHILQARANPLVSADESARLWSAYAAARNSYKRASRAEKALEQQRLNDELLAARDRGDHRLFWSRLKQRRGFFVSRRTPVVVHDSGGNLCSGREAANVFGQVYARIGT